MEKKLSGWKVVSVRVDESGWFIIFRNNNWGQSYALKCFDWMLKEKFNH